MRVLCAMFSLNTQFLGTAMTWPPSVVSSLKKCDYVNIAGVHWKGVQEIVQRQAELFQNRLKTAVRTLTGVEVRFSTPDVALVHATWDVTGWSRPTGETVPVLKRNHHDDDGQN
jgi:hypothetical protein